MFVVHVPSSGRAGSHNSSEPDSRPTRCGRKDQRRRRWGRGSFGSLALTLWHFFCASPSGAGLIRTRARAPEGEGRCPRPPPRLATRPEAAHRSPTGDRRCSPPWAPGGASDDGAARAPADAGGVVGTLFRAEDDANIIKIKIKC